MLTAATVIALGGAVLVIYALTSTDRRLKHASYVVGGACIMTPIALLVMGKQSLLLVAIVILIGTILLERAVRKQRRYH